MRKRRAGAIFLILVLTLVLAGPTLAQGNTVHIVQPGENLFRIGLRYNLTVDVLVAANSLRSSDHIYVGQRLIIPSAGTPAPPTTGSGRDTHTVQRGENLFRIALRYGTTVQALARANGIVNVNRLYAGQRLTIPSSSNPPPVTPPSGVSGRWIDVNLSTQRVTAYDGHTPVRSMLASTGLPRTPTVTGHYRITVKYWSASMSGPGYHFANVPYVMYFYRGYGFHGTYWHNNFGHPMSHGCVNLPTSEARWLFSWAAVGTPVIIHY